MTLKIKSMVIHILALCIACASYSSVPAAKDAGGSTARAGEKANRDSLERGREVFTAFQQAHPGRFGEITTVNGDITITLDNVRDEPAEMQ